MSRDNTALIVNTIMMVITFIVIGFVVFIISKASESDKEFAKKNGIVMSMTEAGVIQSVDFLEDGQSIIRTDKGDFCVYGSFQAMKGSYVAIEKRESGRRYLCLNNEDYCKRLSE